MVDEEEDMTQWYRRFKQTDAFDGLATHVDALPHSDSRIEHDVVTTVLRGVSTASLQRNGYRLEREHTSVPYQYQTTAEGVPIRLRLEGRFSGDQFVVGFVTVGVGRWFGTHTTYTVFADSSGHVSEHWPL